MIEGGKEMEEVEEEEAVVEGGRMMTFGQISHLLGQFYCCWHSLAGLQKKDGAYLVG